MLINVASAPPQRLFNSAACVRKAAWRPEMHQNRFSWVQQCPLLQPSPFIMIISLSLSPLLLFLPCYTLCFPRFMHLQCKPSASFTIPLILLSPWQQYSPHHYIFTMWDWTELKPVTVLSKLLTTHLAVMCKLKILSLITPPHVIPNP